MSDPQPIAVLAATQPRRWLAWGMLTLLGLLLVLVALRHPPAPLWQAYLLLFGIGSVVMADWLRRATQGVLTLYPDALVDSDGTVLARLADIRSIDRGAFAFKPSNGFILRLERRGTRVWRPGLWWRFGRRIGVGGVVPSAPARVMAEQIALMLATRG